jgi:hypothetical protein
MLVCEQVPCTTVWEIQHPTVFLAEENVDLEQMDATVGIISGVIASLVLALVLVVGLSADRIEMFRTTGFTFFVYWVALLTCLAVGQFVCSYYILVRWSEMPQQTDGARIT